MHIIIYNLPQIFLSLSIFQFPFKKIFLSFCSNLPHSLKHIEKIMLDALLMNKTTMFTICDELTVFLVLKIPIFIKKGKKLINVALLKWKKIYVSSLKLNDFPHLSEEMRKS